MLRPTELTGTVSPTVAHILESLKHRVFEGEFRTGDRLPAERALAQTYQVSRTTIRIVLDTLEELGYLERLNGCRPVVSVPEKPITLKSRVARKNIGVWISAEPNDVGAYSVLQGIQAYLDPDRYRLVVASTRGESFSDVIQSESEFLRRVADDPEISGLILWYLGGEANRPGLEALRQANLPVVFVDRRPPTHFPADFVGIDNRDAAKRVVMHLHSRGHKRIAHITNVETACTVRDRLDGYKDALAAARLEFDPSLVFLGPFQEPENERYEAIVSQILQTPNPPTAIFAVNDYSALCVAASLQRAGVQIPHNIEIAGVDDLERWRPGNGLLTTVRQPFERIGTEAARLLVQRLEKQDDAGVFTNVIMDAPLIVRT